MKYENGDLEIDEARLAAVGLDGLHLSMLRDYPYMIKPENVAAFTSATGQEIRKLVNRGEKQTYCIMHKHALARPKLGLLSYL